MQRGMRGEMSDIKMEREMLHERQKKSKRSRRKAISGIDGRVKQNAI
jgi:hypothetical protein